MSNPVKFGKYLLLERIGVGGMAEVFKAKIFGAEGFERLVAIKRILPHLVEDQDFVKMFIDEAKIAVRLSHPHIVGIHDLGRAEGTLYIAMEYVTGKDLRAIYDVEGERGGHTPIGIACYIVMKMAEALHHAHFATGPRGEPLQVIHRDVSPQNVIISFDGEVKVADFGLAKARGRMVQTQAGVVKGKLAYMSPEQLRGDEIDHRVDVFGLGIVLFELLTGHRLFLGPSDMDTLRRVYEARVPPMQELNPEVHPDLEAIVRKALAKDREERYGTAIELHDDLQYFAYSSGVYGGAASLRAYLHELFPDDAPEEQVPQFAPPAPAEAVPPPVPPAAAAARDHQILPPASEASAKYEAAALRESQRPVPEVSEPSVSISMGADEEDRDPSVRIERVERPGSPAVVMHRTISTGVPPAEGSRTQQRMPSEPPGIYEDDQTDQIPPQKTSRITPDHDTNPAPAIEDVAPPLPSDETLWSDEDEPTLFNAVQVPDVGQNPVPPPEWNGDGEDEQTLIVPSDPKTSHGR